MLEMGTSYLPVNQNWGRYIHQSNTAFQDMQRESKQLLIRLANDACEYVHDDEWVTFCFEKVYMPSKSKNMGHSKTCCTCNYPKIWAVWFYHTIMRSKDAAKLSNSVDPNHTAPSLQVNTVCPVYLSVWILRNITVFLCFEEECNCMVWTL